MFHRMTSPLVFIHIAETNRSIKIFARGVVLVNQKSNAGQSHVISTFFGGSEQTTGYSLMAIFRENGQ